MERNSSILPIVGVFMAVEVGFWTGHILAQSQDNTSEKVRNVQTYNSQLHDQLSGTYNPLDNLVLTNGDGKTFTFHTQSTTGQGESCSGNYEVKANVASAVGDIACTQVMSAHK